MDQATGLPQGWAHPDPESMPFRAPLLLGTPGKRGNVLVESRYLKIRPVLGSINSNRWGNLHELFLGRDENRGPNSGMFWHLGLARNVTPVGFSDSTAVTADDSNCVFQRCNLTV